MLGQMGIAVLVLMLFTFALSGVFAMIMAFVCLRRKMYGHAIKSIVYLVLLAVTTVSTSLPFLKMHGSYSDNDRLLIIFFCLLNIALIFLYVVTRIRILDNVGNDAPHGDSLKAAAPRNGAS